MKLTYDPKYNIAYIRLQEKQTAVESIHLSEAVNVDLAPDGTVYGVELLYANEQLREQNTKKLIVELSNGKTLGIVDLEPTSH